MVNPKKSQTTNIVIGCFALMLIAGCALAALFAILSTTSSPKSVENERISLSYAELIAQKKSMTETQWKSYEAEIKGKRVRWSGYVAQVADDIRGINYVWVDMHGNANGDRDLYFEYPVDASMALNKNQLIIFEGDYDGYLLGTVELKNAAILP